VLDLCDAILTRHLVRLNYEGYQRTVEPHAVGDSSKGAKLLLAWQIAGGSVHNEPVGWKMLSLDETRGIQVLAETFPGPRPDYRRGNKAMKRIDCQL
jgi:hypothetical protein